MDILANLVKDRMANAAKVALTAAICTIWITGCASVPPPKDQIAVAKSEVMSATRGGGNEYAPVELKSATEKMDGAEQAMVKEDYALARKLAEEAQLDARLAETKTALAKAQKAVKDSQESNEVMREEIKRATP